MRRRRRGRPRPRAARRRAARRSARRRRPGRAASARPAVASTTPGAEVGSSTQRSSAGRAAAGSRSSVIGAVLDEQEPVAGLAVGDAGVVARRLVRRASTPSSGAAAGAGRRRFHGGRATRLDAASSPVPATRPAGVGGGGLVAGPRHQPHPVAGRELAELPPLGGGDDGRADEAAEARPVGAEDDRHVTGDVDRADGVAVSWMFDGCRPASPPSSRAHRGRGPISRTPVRAELKCTSHVGSEQLVEARRR